MINNKMQISAEISLYPLIDDYEAIIIRFIKLLSNDPEITYAVNGMSTQITGPTKNVFRIIETSLTELFSDEKNVVAVVKYLNKAIEPGVKLDI